MIGVAISTHNRQYMLDKSLEAWEKHLPAGAVLAVIDDGSEPPAIGATHRQANSGVAATKNAGIAALMDAGCDHLFLVDDDCWPTRSDWYEGYRADRLPHLMLCWGFSRRRFMDGHYTHWSHPRGVMLYVERYVIDSVGGMRTEFGRWGDEHVEWSRRIHNAGHTPVPFIDLRDSDHFWHAEDLRRPYESAPQFAERRRGQSTVPTEERRATDAHRAAVMAKYDGSTEYVTYR